MQAEVANLPYNPVSYTRSNSPKANVGKACPYVSTYVSSLVLLSDPGKQDCSLPVVAITQSSSFC